MKHVMRSVKRIQARRRKGRVGSIKNSVWQGTYSVDSLSIARSIVNRLKPQSVQQD
jgi:anti-sigma28 factor (negative regulator of flagellin synthesis)